jgi:hypothetical protein
MGRLRKIRCPRRSPGLRQTPYRERPRVEPLESRDLLSVLTAAPMAHRPPPGGSAYTPAQILHAYGFDQLSLAQPGQGQTIAIVEAFVDPTIQSDVATFDARYGLPAANLTVINDGATGADPTGGWQQETALDVEWAHVVAPYANIVVVDAANDATDITGVPEALLHAVTVAASRPNVHVVSMSWGYPEFPSETQFDGFFSTPGITYVAASGDNGAPATWPTVAPNVLAVGGTTLQLDSAGNILSEIGWGNGLRSPDLGGSGGGFSLYEPEPAYQQGLGFTSVADTGGTRMNPDVAYVGDPNTGLSVYDSGGGGWSIVAGTSAGTPQWAALVALADQAGAAATPAQAPLGSQQTVAALYQAQEDFHDITAGNNGYPAAPGYDLVTGLGTPMANLLVPALARAEAVNQEFVTRVYQSLLSRAPDAAGLAAWSNAIDMGYSRAALALQIEQSPEYLGDRVDAIYQKLLHRAADPGGRAAFINFLTNGGTLEQMQAIIAGSDEYFQNRGGGQIDGFLNALYQDALNRPIDPSGLAADEQGLSHGMTRQQVASVVFSSPEYLQDTVTSYYQTYLNRPPDSGGLNAFVAAMEAGMTDQQVIADLLASPEFFGKL